MNFLVAVPESAPPNGELGSFRGSGVGRSLPYVLSLPRQSAAAYHIVTVSGPH
jgi:hypothetical protein